jgi:hypothetical protein
MKLVQLKLSDQAASRRQQLLAIAIPYGTNVCSEEIWETDAILMGTCREVQ